MPKLFISTTVGREDPTRASIPFHIALNGASATGTDCGVAFAGDATELLRPDVGETVRGVGHAGAAGEEGGCGERGE